MKTQITIIISLTMLFFSCRSNQDPPNTSSPEVTEAHGYGVPQDSVTEPRIVPILKPVIKIAKPPIVRAVNSNVVSAGIPKVVVVGEPRIFEQGKGGLEPVLVVPAISKPRLAGIPEIVAAKDPHTKEKNPFSFSSFGKIQGLNTSEASCVVEDRKGNLWISTMAGGVSKYDGNSFTHYTIKEGLGNNYVWSILEDRKGNLWFGTVGFGVSKFDGRTFTNYTSKEGMVDDNVYDIYEDRKGDLWFGTNNGISIFDGSTFRNLTTKQGLSNNSVSRLMEDKSGNMWISTLAGLDRYDGKSFVRYSEKEGLQANYFQSIYKDRDENLWLGSNMSGVAKFDGKTFTWFTTKEGLSENNVMSITQDRSGAFWFGTHAGGLNRYDGKTFTHFTTEHGLSNNKISGILEDRRGNLWVATALGLNKYDGNRFTHFTVSDGLSNNDIRCIVEDRKGNLWFGTWEGGVMKYNGNTFTHYSYSQGMRNDAVVTMLEDRNENIWFGDYSGICMFDGRSFTHFAENPIDVFSIAEDKNGNIWFGTFNGGALKYDGKNFTHYTTKEGLNSNNVMRILSDKQNNIWFATYGGGLSMYDGRKFTRFSTLEGLADDYLYNIHIDRNDNVWIASLNNGLIKFDGKKFIRYTTKDGLASDEIRTIAQDRTGNLWIGTMLGLSKLDKNEINKENPRFKSYTYEDGFIGIEINPGATIKESKDGTIWIGSVDRLTAFHPENDFPDTIAPNIQLVGVMLHNENIPWQDLQSGLKAGATFTNNFFSNGAKIHDVYFDSVSKWYGVPISPSLPYNNNDVSFRYVGITIQSPKKVRYQYKLEGLDENWNSPTGRTEATYGNLPHGHYTFKVKAMNGDGYWSNELSYQFVIRPPWWFTWWAYTLFAILSVGIVYSLFRYRINKIRDRHEIELQKHKVTELEMQALRAQMNPHFIFNSLNSINLFILDNNKLLASEYLTKFSRLVGAILHNSTESLISLDRELEALRLYLEIESLRFNGRFQFDIEVDNNVDTSTIKVPPLIIQPYAENAIWHGLMNKKENGRLQIHLYQEQNILYCKIVDDGVGRKKAAEFKSKFRSSRKSVGMRNTSDRIALMQDKKLNGDFIVVTDIVLPDGSPGGTKVLLKIPVLT